MPIMPPVLHCHPFQLKHSHPHHSKEKYAPEKKAEKNSALAGQARGEDAVQRCVNLPTQAYQAVEDRSENSSRSVGEAYTPSRIEYALAGHSRRRKIGTKPFLK